jgi:hypothetical protein
MIALPVLAGLLVGCGGAAASSIAHPKKISSATECGTIASASTVSKATGLTATKQLNPTNAADCGFDLTDQAQADAGQVTIALGLNHAVVNGAVTTGQVEGNPAQQQKLSGLGPGQYGCAYFVTLDGNATLNTLTVTVLTNRTSPDACSSAQSIATSAFDLLPSA